MATDTAPTTSAAAGAAATSAHPSATGPPGSPPPSGPRPRELRLPVVRTETTRVAEIARRSQQRYLAFLAEVLIPTSRQRATSPPRPVGGSGPVDRGRTVHVIDDADPRVFPVLKHWRDREHPASARSDGDVVDAQLAVAVPELDDARPRVAQVTWADRSGEPGRE
jgi:hypothetical protein